jgi:hypothetical protein
LTALRAIQSVAFVLVSVCAPFRAAIANPAANGYSGIWYMNQPSGDEYKYKYSGGFATYPQQHVPMAIYSSDANKTFFCYGGTAAKRGGDKQELLHMVSYFDHATGQVPRPTILLNKKTSDAHDNPTIALDDLGHVYIFSPSHGTARPSYIHRSRKPYSIADFDLLVKTNFSYPEPWFIPGHGFIFLHTRYREGRNLFSMTSLDGKQWTNSQPLARIGMGDYQVSWRNGDRLATAFDFHPAPLGLNGRANIYYLETRDFGATWLTVTGKRMGLPIIATNNEALVYDSRADKLLVYLKDLNFDAAGHPIILFLTSKGYESGPKNDPRTWNTVRWTGQTWEFRTVTTSDNNYDHGSLYMEGEGIWRMIAPTDPGPQPYNPGGEMAEWLTKDHGATWTKTATLTEHSPLNHTYARRPFNAHPDFYAFWADGNAREPSTSSLYFTNQKGDHVWRLPKVMTSDFATPEIVKP